MLALPSTVAAADLAGYRAELREALAALDRGDATDAARRLRSIGTVSLPDATVIAPNSDLVLADVEASPPRLEVARARLSALVAELGTEPVRRDRQDAERQLQRVLARGEFAQPEGGPLAAVGRWVGDQVGAAWRLLRELLRSLFGGADLELPPIEAPRGLDTPVAVGGILLLLGLAGVVALGVRGSTARPPPRAPAEPAPVARSADFRAEAARLAAAGEFRAAVRALGMAALLEGEEQGIQRFDRALTNAELVRRARAAAPPERAERLAVFLARFDRFWYGGAPGGPSDYAELAGLSQRLWAA